MKSWDTASLNQPIKINKGAQSLKQTKLKNVYKTSGVSLSSIAIVSNWEYETIYLHVWQYAEFIAHQFISG